MPPNSLAPHFLFFVISHNSRPIGGKATSTDWKTLPQVRRHSLRIARDFPFSMTISWSGYRSCFTSPTQNCSWPLKDTDPVLSWGPELGSYKTHDRGSSHRADDRPAGFPEPLWLLWTPVPLVRVSCTSEPLFRRINRVWYSKPIWHQINYHPHEWRGWRDFRLGAFGWFGMPYHGYTSMDAEPEHPISIEASSTSVYSDRNYYSLKWQNDSG